jgi:hypothetical protein
MWTRGFRVTFFRHRETRRGIAVVLGLVFLPGFAASLTRDFPEAALVRGTTAAGYLYLNGGTSFEEQRLIERSAHLYNLKLVFARTAGTLTTPAFVVIGSNAGGPVEKISLGGPWLYLQLPPGGYTVLARFQRQVVLLRDVNMRKGRRSTYVLRGD